MILDLKFGVSSVWTSLVTKHFGICNEGLMVSELTLGLIFYLYSSQRSQGVSVEGGKGVGANGASRLRSRLRNLGSYPSAF